MNRPAFDVKETGTVLEVRRAIARIHGLPTSAYAQPLFFQDGGSGMVIGFDKNEVLALLFHDAADLKSGDKVFTRAQTLEIPAGDGFLGRIVNGLGEICDGKETVQPDAHIPVFSEAPGITDRALLTRQLFTGTKIIDSMIPIAKGQRELIIGDRITGKTTVAVDAILNQKGKDVICIYCCIGRSYSFLVKLTQLLRERGAFAYSLIVASTADAPAGQQYLSPYTAACLGEYFMKQGRDVLVIFDDLSKHAWIYREISLLMDRSPGREAYPGDIFYIHSQLVERAAQLKPELGGGSMTFLPIVETQQGDITSYISSNLISMTDGQIYFSSDYYQEGFKPAIDLSLSVSRIGNKIQGPAIRSLCGTLRLDYVQYRELLNITKLRSTISGAARMKIRRGEAVVQALKQNKNQPVETAEQILLFYALKRGALDDMPAELVGQFKELFYPYLKERHPLIVEKLRASLSLEDSLKEELDRIFREFARRQSWPEEFESVEAKAGEE